MSISRRIRSNGEEDASNVGVGGEVIVGRISSRGEATVGLNRESAAFPEEATAISGETRCEKCRFSVRSRMVRLMGLSSTINARKPPDSDDEKESRDLWRVKYFRGEEADRRFEDVVLG